MPWESLDEAGGATDLRRLAMQLIAAAIQVRQVGSIAAVEEARRILVDSRRAMYRLLADEDGGSG